VNKVLTRLLVPLVLLLVVVGLLVTREEGAGERTVTAHFPRAVSVYVGTDVRILGVNVGKVTAVEPDGESVRVEMSYDAEYDVPADARAVVVTPTLVADRFVQLTPVFQDGDQVMADDADIPLEQTAVPVELDRIYASLQDLTRTLGPNGVNEDGTLDRVLGSGAGALEGQGAKANEMLRELSEAARTFGDGSGDLFETVTRLAKFTTVLSQNDATVRRFIRELTGVSGQLAGERQEIQQLLGALSGAVGVVESFVRDNREALGSDVRKLSRVLKTIDSERENLDTALAVAPVAMGNLFLAYNTESGTIGSRITLNGNVQAADQLLCSLLTYAEVPDAVRRPACALFDAVVGPVADNAGPIPPPGNRAGALGQGAGSGGGATQPLPTTAVDRFATDSDADLDGLLGGAR
jgi:phospholipid/cholesterol/gamma-HCH transport system substrate-binding protein